MYPKYYFYDDKDHICLSLSENELISMTQSHMQKEIETSDNSEQINKLKEDLEFLRDTINKNADKAEIALAYLSDSDQKFKEPI